jgi:hypothetical protein
MREELSATADNVAAMPAGPHGIIEQVCEEIDKRCVAILNTLGK